GRIGWAAGPRGRAVRDESGRAESGRTPPVGGERPRRGGGGADGGGHDPGQPVSAAPVVVGGGTRGGGRGSLCGGWPPAGPIPGLLRGGAGVAALVRRQPSPVDSRVRGGDRRWELRRGTQRGPRATGPRRGLVAARADPCRVAARRGLSERGRVVAGGGDGGAGRRGRPAGEPVRQPPGGAAAAHRRQVGRPIGDSGAARGRGGLGGHRPLRRRLPRGATPGRPVW